MLRPLLLAAFAASAMAAEPFIFAHRGASRECPENTLASFRQGYADGAEACELDVYLSKDGVAVVSHDESTKRTTGVDRKIKDLTVAELKQLDAGSWKDTQFANERIPTLAEALATVPPGRKMVIEIKDSAKVLPAVVQAVAESKLGPEQIILFGFKYETMQAARPLFPQCAMYWLVGYKAGKEGKYPDVQELAARARAANFDGLALNWHFPIDRAFAAYVHSAGLKLLVWTVDEPEDARRLFTAGVDGLGTDRAGWLREQLRR